MILKPGHSSKYLTDLHEGKIKKGLGLGMRELDRVIRYKQGQFNIILGHDNVGKTFWFEWYMTALSSQYNLKWAVWLGENTPGQAMRDIIQFISGKHFQDLTINEVRRYEAIVDQWFSFVDNKKRYTPSDLLKLFEDTECDGCFIDPYTGLDRGYSHADNYEFLNNCRAFVNSTKKTLYVSTHPNSESGRQGRMYPKGHEFEGHLMPPLKDHVEGGKPFTNRVDDFIIIHRLVKHMGDMKFKTFVDIAKIKDRETGGEVTGLDNPVWCDYNSGLGFKTGFDTGVKIIELKKPNITPNLNF